MGDYSDVFGLSLFVLTISMVSIAGGAQFFIFNFDYVNQSVAGDTINVGLDDAVENNRFEFTYYNESADKIMVNQTETENVSGGTPKVFFNPNVTGIESYTIQTEIPAGYYNQCGGSVSYQQGFLSQEMLDGYNQFENRRGDGEFSIRWYAGVFDGEECYDLLYNSNITSITAEFPAASEVGTLDFVQQLTSAESGYQWFNYIIMGSIGILIGYIIIKIARGN